MGSLFSSPSKQANAAASASQGISQQDIAQLENYVSGQQQQLRGAISGLGPNPYFAAGNQMNPANYRINPADTVGFGSQGPGTQTVVASNPVQANPYPSPQTTNPSPTPPANQPPPSTTPPTPPTTPKPIQPPTQKPIGPNPNLTNGDLPPSRIAPMPIRVQQPRMQ